MTNFGEWKNWMHAMTYLLTALEQMNDDQWLISAWTVTSAYGSCMYHHFATPCCPILPWAALSVL